jgi:hypothetical protein
MCCWSLVYKRKRTRRTHPTCSRQVSKIKKNSANSSSQNLSTGPTATDFALTCEREQDKPWSKKFRGTCSTPRFVQNWHVQAVSSATLPSPPYSMELAAYQWQCPNSSATRHLPASLRAAFDQFVVSRSFFLTKMKQRLVQRSPE